MNDLALISLQWYNAWSSPTDDGFSLGLALICLGADATIYAMIASVLLVYKNRKESKKDKCHKSSLFYRINGINVFLDGRNLTWSEIICCFNRSNDTIPLTQDNLKVLNRPKEVSSRGLSIVIDPETGRPREVAVSLTGLTKKYE